MVEVPDDRIDQLAKLSKSEKIIPTAIEFVDIAGLVKGAHKGEGLGNKFLANIREVDIIVQVVRSFEDTNVHHVEGSIDPSRDVEVVEIELAMADLAAGEKRLQTVQGKMKAGRTKELEREEGILKRVFDALAEGKPARDVTIDEEEEELIKPLSLLTIKPVLYLLNVDEASLSDDQPRPSRRAGATLSGDQPAAATLSLCVKIESEIMEMPKEEQKEFLQALGLKQSGLDSLIAKCYELLELITFFTSGEKETRAWTIMRGTKAPQAAGKIHTDFEKGFIRAEVINWKDFVELGEAGAGEAGKLGIEGKDYVMQDGDVCHFRISV